MVGMVNVNQAAVLIHAGQDSKGIFYKADDVLNLILNSIKTNQYFENRGKKMSKDLEKATKLVDESMEGFSRSIDKLVATENRMVDATKKVSTKVRETTQKLSEGLAKIEKQANFDRLERYVILLERASAAIESLAVMEKSGKLDKIATAIR